MNIEKYKTIVKENGFEEHPYTIYDGITELKHFISYDNIDIDLKIHLAKIILCRNFSPAGGYCVLSDHDWYIEKFLQDFTNDPIRSWLTGTIKESIQMILSGETFTKEIIGSTFMFGVVEFYAKYLLGWRPLETDSFDEKTDEPFKVMTLSVAIGKLKKGNTNLAVILNYIDNQSVNRLKEVMIGEKKRVKARIADRLYIARNSMLHGEDHSFSYIGKYLCMLYILFYLCDEKASKN